MDNLKISVAFEPSMALIIYQNNSEPRELNQYYIESHSVVNGQMSGGKPLTMDCFNDLTEFFLTNRHSMLTVQGLIPTNLLYQKSNLKGWPDMVWQVNSGPKEMHFAESLHIPSGLARTPSLVFAILSGAFYVFALASDERASADTQLYVPPFHNCGMSGSVCLGSAKLAKPTKLTWESMMQYHEARFWRTVFTHNGSASINGNLNLVWKDLVQNPEKEFDTKLLIKSKLLKDIIQ